MNREIRLFDHHDEVRAAVLTASNKWKEAFNSGDASKCAALYETNAVMNAEPLGIFIGRVQIQTFWKIMVKSGYKDLVHLDPKVEVIGEKSAILSCDWTMNKAWGVINSELWVIQSDGSVRLREGHFEVQT